MCRIAESLYCMSETNTVLYINYSLIFFLNGKTRDKSCESKLEKKNNEIEKPVDQASANLFYKGQIVYILGFSGHI